MRNSSLFILRSGQACHAAALVALVLTLFLTAAVEAQTPILKFDDPTTPGGTVSWAGPGSGIVGTNIQFQSILGIDTPLNAGAPGLTCSNCLLNFLTAQAAATIDPVSGVIVVTAQSGVTTVTLTGGVPELGIPDGSTLLSGVFAGNPREVIGPEENFGLFVGTVPDTKHPALAAHFGLDPQTFTFGTTSVQAITTVDEATGAFTGSVVNADLNNTAPVPGEGCLTRTPGFWGNHPHITSLFLPLTVCGVNLNTVEAGSGTSATEAICSVGNDGQILGPQLTQLVRQCTAALLNVTASAVGGGNCPGDFPTLESLLDGCCGAESVCTGAPVEGLTIQSCIDQLDAFNNSPDTLPPFGPFVSPGPADSSECRDARNNGVVVRPAP
jgi:hypothetical protein